MVRDLNTIGASSRNGRRAIIGIDASRVSASSGLGGSRPTGTERYSTELIRALLELEAEEVNAGVLYRLYARAALPEELAAAAERVGAEVRVVRPRRGWTQVGLAAEMLYAAPDVLFVPSHTVPWIHPRRTVVTCHDVAFEVVPDCYAPRDRARLQRATRGMCTRAARLIVPSQAVKEDVVRVYGVDSARVHVIYHGAPRAEKIVAHQAASPAGDAPYVVSIGRIECKKNTLALARAFVQAVEREQLPHHLVLVGSDGFGAQEVREFARTTDRVHLLGYLPDEQARALLARATALLFPSLAEGFGLPVLEGFVAGVPVLTSREGALAEIAGNAAELRDPRSIDDLAQGIALLAQSAPRRAELVRAGHERARDFSWHRAAQETRALLLQLLTQ